MTPKDGVTDPAAKVLWRPARQTDHEDIVGMSLAYFSEDPGVVSVSPEQIANTLRQFDREPSYGQAVILEVDDGVAGYSLLVPFYSNEMGGLVCVVDELFVRPAARGRGCGTALFRAIEAGQFGAYRAMMLGVTPRNDRARRLYERLGFRVAGVTMVCLR